MNKVTLMEKGLTLNCPRGFYADNKKMIKKSVWIEVDKINYVRSPSGTVVSLIFGLQGVVQKVQGTEPDGAPVL